MLCWLRRVVPCTAIALLSLTTPAESAWVLWDIEVPPNGSPTIYTVDSAHETREACDSLAREKAERPWNKPPLQKSFVRFVCLPDTVDPRGPKGK